MENKKDNTTPYFYKIRRLRSSRSSLSKRELFEKKYNLQKVVYRWSRYCIQTVYQNYTQQIRIFLNAEVYWIQNCSQTLDKQLNQNRSAKKLVKNQRSTIIIHSLNQLRSYSRRTERSKKYNQRTWVDLIQLAKRESQENLVYQLHWTGSHCGTWGLSVL